MRNRTGVALGVLALIAGSGMTALPALAEDTPAGDLETAAASEAEWQKNLEARLTRNAQTIAADAMSAASEIDLSEKLDLEEPNHLLALATKQ